MMSMMKLVLAPALPPANTLSWRLVSSWTVLELARAPMVLVAQLMVEASMPVAVPGPT